MTPEQLAPGVFPVRYGSDIHSKVIKAFTSRHKIALEAQQKEMTEKWKTAEDRYLMYIPETDADSARRVKKDAGTPQYTTIQIPYSYAMLLTSHTYYTSVFLSRNPVLQMQGRHGESQQAESAMESLLDYQLHVGQGVPALFQWLLDVGKYGHGVLGHYWDEEKTSVTQYADVPKTFLGVPLGTFERKLVTTMQTGFVGNKLYNVRPQDFMYDPRVSLVRFQEGEFCIVLDTVGWNKIARGKADGRYYNTEHLKKEGAATSSGDHDPGSPRIQLPNQDDIWYSHEDGVPAKVDLHEFHWEVIPRALGLGASERPEKWVFTIANKRIVISAQPLGLIHNKYPFSVLTHEVDMYSLFTRGMLTVLDPLNQTMEWLLNSHFFNVRAALNNNFLVDPSMVVMKDVEDRQPGKLIRLKPAAYGKDVRTLMTQFSVQDVTRSNLQDTEIVAALAQRMVGVTDNVMGMLNTGGRRTATEVRSSTTFGINRLKTNCEWFSAQGFSPLSQQLVANTQQLYSLERKYRIVGDLARWGEKYMMVTPADIAGHYDFVAVDGTMPVDRFAQANLWNQLLGTISKVPNVMMQYDLAKVFAFVAQLGGIKNIEQFRVQVVPDGMVPPGSVPMAGAPNPVRAELNEPGQVPGLGRTG